LPGKFDKMDEILSGTPESIKDLSNLSHDLSQAEKKITVVTS